MLSFIAIMYVPCDNMKKEIKGQWMLWKVKKKWSHLIYVFMFMSSDKHFLLLFFFYHMFTHRSPISYFYLGIFVIFLRANSIVLIHWSLDPPRARRLRRSPRWLFLPPRQGGRPGSAELRRWSGQSKGRIHILRRSEWDDRYQGKNLEIL